MSEGEIPADGMELTRILVMSDVVRAKPFYTDVLHSTALSEGEGGAVL